MTVIICETFMCIIPPTYKRNTILHFELKLMCKRTRKNWNYETQTLNLIILNFSKALASHGIINTSSLAITQVATQ